MSVEKSLGYFDDAEREPAPIDLQGQTWNEVKAAIQASNKGSDTGIAFERLMHRRATVSRNTRASRPPTTTIMYCTVTCPTCFESFSFPAPAPTEVPADWDYDCEVCCRPMRIRFDLEAGEVVAEAEPA